MEAHRPSHPIELDLLTGLENPSCSRPIFNPDLGLAAGLHSIARGVNRIEKRLFLIQVGAIQRISAVERIAEHDDPSRFPSLAADLKLHRSHWLNSLAENLSQDESHSRSRLIASDSSRARPVDVNQRSMGGNIGLLDQNLCEVVHTIRRF
jgi:hypothetical protein